MKILAFETSAKAASVALLTDGQLTGEYFQNSGQTHSRTVMKLAKDLLDNCDLSPSDLDLIAWANGPGSFTGVRIGVAAAKGLCWGLELPCVPVSTLEAMAWSAAVQDGIVCCCMDARRSQVYNAVFEIRDGRPVRIREDRAISIEELAEDLAAFSGPILLTGDGAALVYETLCGGRADQIESRANTDAPPHPSSGLRETPDATVPSRGRLLRAADDRPYGGSAIETPPHPPQCAHWGTFPSRGRPWIRLVLWLPLEGKLSRSD